MRPLTSYSEEERIALRKKRASIVDEEYEEDEEIEIQKKMISKRVVFKCCLSIEEYTYLTEQFIKLGVPRTTTLRRLIQNQLLKK